MIERDIEGNKFLVLGSLQKIFLDPREVEVVRATLRGQRGVGELREGLRVFF
jgi:hypothetical protein